MNSNKAKLDRSCDIGSDLLVNAEREDMLPADDDVAMLFKRSERAESCSGIGTFRGASETLRETMD